MKTFLFWLGSCSWGILMTLYGAVLALGLMISGHRPRRFCCFVLFEVGENWGGMEAGGFIIVNRGASEQLKLHEAGHGVQNLMFGPLTPFLVSIPSAIRYWVRRYRVRRGEGGRLRDYDSVWFEGMATELGEKYFAKRSSGRRSKLRLVK